MNYIIYIDVYFFVNFFMNGLLLCLLRFCGEKGRRSLTVREAGKIVLGALAGGVLSCIVMIFLPGNLFMLPPILINGLTGYLMLWIAFGNKGVRRRMGQLGRLWLLEWLLCGALTMAFGERDIFFSGREKDTWGKSPNLLSVAGTAIFACLVLKELVKGYKREQKLLKNLYAVEMRHRGRSCAGTGLLDTGNHLREPVTRKPVVITELSAAKRLLGEEEAGKVLRFQNMGQRDLEPNFLVRWIPYHSLGNPNGFMPGILIEEMVIYREEGEQICKGVWMGIMEEELSEKGLYQFILHEEYMEPV